MNNITTSIINFTRSNGGVISVGENSATDAVGTGIIDSAGFILVYDIFTVIWLVFSLCGIATNSMNVRTFLAMGVEDGVTVSFLALSISDLCFGLAAFLMGVSALITVFEVKYNLFFPVAPFTLVNYSGNLCFIFNSITGMTTIFIAVARCMCVAKPLHFKNVFTRSRSIIIHSIFPVIALACYVPLLSQTGAQWGFDQAINQTRYAYWISEIREDIKDMIYLIVDTILSLVVQIVIISCIAIMANRLQKSKQFRESFQTAGDEDKGRTRSVRLSGKELQVIKQVLLISVIYILCSLPKMFTSIYTQFEPRFDLTKTFNNFYCTINFLRVACELVNSASTLPIYYIYNSKFRSFTRPVKVEKTPQREPQIAQLQW